MLSNINLQSVTFSGGESEDDVTTIRGHPLSTYAKFSEKLIFLTPDTHMFVCVSGRQKC